MDNIFTRAALSRVIGDESLPIEQRAEQVYDLYARALEEGYVSRAAARQAQEAAVEAARERWAREHVDADPTQSAEYRELEERFEAFRAQEAARRSPEYAAVKPKFFETVYGMVERGEGAKPLEEQLAAIREAFEEYFLSESEASRPPRFSAPIQGSMPRGERTAAETFASAWGFGGK